MFSDAVACELFKTAAEVAEIEDESVAESSRRKKRALIGAGLTAAALGGLALGAYALHKPVETMGADIDKSVLPKERGTMAATGDAIKSITETAAGPAGLGAAAALGGAAAARFALPKPVYGGDVANLSKKLLLEGDAQVKPSFMREFGRGMLMLPGSSQADVAENIRTQLAGDPGTDVDKMRRGLAGMLTGMGRGDVSTGALGSKRSLLELASRPIGLQPDGKTPLTLDYHLGEDLKNAAKGGRFGYDTNVQKIFDDLRGPNRAGYPGSVETAAAEPQKPGGRTAIQPQGMDSIVKKLTTLVDMHEKSEQARNRILSGTYTNDDVKAAANGELARKILGDIGAQGAAESKDKGGKDKGKDADADKAAKSVEKERAKLKANIDRGVKAVKALTGSVGGTTRGVTRNMIPRALGGGTMGALLSSAPYLANTLFPGE
jgi:hypothetical protein